MPFHWEIEFPEVFARENDGFDAIVGNPPFLGGARISEEFGRSYFSWLTGQYAGCRHQCDLVGYFFRRAFNILGISGYMGFLATKTLAEGDTREGSLLPIVRAGGIIYRAITRYRWPGEASIIVSVVHISKQKIFDPLNLNEQEVSRISAYLRVGDVDEAPKKLHQNAYYSKGSLIYGQGFLFDNSDAKSNDLDVMNKILTEEPELSNRIRMFVSGEDVNRESTSCLKSDSPLTLMM